MPIQEFLANQKGCDENERKAILSLLAYIDFNYAMISSLTFKFDEPIEDKKELATVQKATPSFEQYKNALLAVVNNVDSPLPRATEMEKKIVAVYQILNNEDLYKEYINNFKKIADKLPQEKQGTRFLQAILKSEANSAYVTLLQPKTQNQELSDSIRQNFITTLNDNKCEKWANLFKDVHLNFDKSDNDKVKEFLKLHNVLHLALEEIKWTGGLSGKQSGEVNNQFLSAIRASGDAQSSVAKTFHHESELKQALIITKTNWENAVQSNALLQKATAEPPRMTRQ